LEDGLHRFQDILSISRNLCARLAKVGERAAAIGVTEVGPLGEIYSGELSLRAKVASAMEPPSTLVWPAATIAAAAAFGAVLAKGEVKFAILPVAAVLAFLFAGVPAAGYVAVLWSVGTAVDMLALPQVGVSSLQFMPAEILLWIALGSLIFLPRDVQRGLRSLATGRESVAVAVFLAAVVCGVAVGVENGANVQTAAQEMRIMLFYAAFWLALAALSRGRILVFAVISAGVVAVVILQVIQAIVGPSPHLFLIASEDVTSTFTSEGTGFLRVRPPGLTTVYVVAGFSVARVLWGPRRHRLFGWGLMAVTLTGVVLSLNRNMLLGLVLGLCVAALIAPQRHRFVVLLATLGMALAAFSLVAQGSSAIESNGFISRFTSITNYSGLKTQTLNDRYYENRIALQRIRAHPIGGLGWGPDYGAMFLHYDDGFLVSQPRDFMHEQYLWIWMRAGIIGLLALIAMLTLGIWNGARWCRAMHGKDDAWLGAGVVVSLVAMAASSNVAIYLTPPDSTVPLVGVLALAAVMRRDLAHQ
jgi:hypothetical protein